MPRGLPIKPMYVFTWRIAPSRKYQGIIRDNLRNLLWACACRDGHDSSYSAQTCAIDFNRGVYRD